VNSEATSARLPHPTIAHDSESEIPKTSSNWKQR
jgi:hypothetical protein